MQSDASRRSHRRIGVFDNRVAAWLAGWWRVFHFGAIALVVAFSPSAYDRETRNVMAKQIYFTALQILPGFILVSALACYVVMRAVISAATAYGFTEYAQDLALRILVVDLVPVFVAIFVALRSGSAIGTEIVLMHINGELDALQRRGADPMRHALVPRVIGSTVSVIALIAVGSAIALMLGYVGVYGLSPWGLEDFTRSVGQIFDPTATFGLVMKTVMFGLTVAVIPITASLEMPRVMRLAPIGVLNGMVRLFLTLTLIEGASLGIRYL
jgi:phospholipid/cholesterol/gamma-HCH transport system permease protein